MTLKRLTDVVSFTWAIATMPLCLLGFVLGAVLYPPIEWLRSGWSRGTDFWTE